MCILLVCVCGRDERFGDWKGMIDEEVCASPLGIAGFRHQPYPRAPMPRKPKLVLALIPDPACSHLHDEGALVPRRVRFAVPAVVVRVVAHAADAAAERRQRGGRGRAQARADVQQSDRARSALALTLQPRRRGARHGQRRRLRRRRLHRGVVHVDGGCRPLKPPGLVWRSVSAPSAATARARFGARRLSLWCGGVAAARQPRDVLLCSTLLHCGVVEEVMVQVLSQPRVVATARSTSFDQAEELDDDDGCQELPQSSRDQSSSRGAPDAVQGTLKKIL